MGTLGYRRKKNDVLGWLCGEAEPLGGQYNIGSLTGRRDFKHRCCRFARALASSDSRQSSFSLSAGETLLLRFNFVSPMELFATLCNCKSERHIPDSSLTVGRCIYQLHRFRGFYGGNAANGVGWYYSGTHHLRRWSRRTACGFRAPAV